MASCEFRLLSWIRVHQAGFLLLLILIFSLLLKIICWYLEPVVSRDGCLYLRFIQCWRESGKFPGGSVEWSEFNTPHLMLFLVKFLMVSGLSAEAAGVSLNIVLGSLTPLLGYGIAHEITQNFRISICSALLLAVNPAMNKLSIEIQRDSIFLFFAGAALWLLCAGVRRQKWGFWLGAGMMSGMAMLVRVEAFDLLGIMLIALAVLGGKKYLSWGKCVFRASVFLGGFLFMLFGLSCLMQTEETLRSNYSRYFHGKIYTLQQHFSKTSEK